MILLQNVKAIAVNQTTVFSAVGGTPPYTYAVAGGGAGGTIQPNGIYKAPSKGGTDIISVTDSLMNVVTAEIAILTPVELVCDILLKEMDLDEDQVILYNQKFTIPNDERLYIAVGVLNDRIFGSNRRPVDSLGYDVEQAVNVQATLSIDIMSRTTEALERREEIILALNSIYAQTQQEANSFHLGRIPTSFANLSEGDGAAIPYRFSISVNIQYAVRKVRSVEYFDQFEEPTIVTNN